MGLPYAALGGDGVFGFVVGIYGGRDVVVAAAAEDVAAVFQFYHAHGGLCIFFLHIRFVSVSPPVSGEMVQNLIQN